MTEHEKHLITFQNLCVIAFVDGHLHPEERKWLLESASGMGITDEERDRLMNQGQRLDFIIPREEADCYIELRMVVLTVSADGMITEREWRGCQKLAERMGIPETYLEEIRDFYQEKQQERNEHLAIFQNLYLIAAADGIIGPAEQELLLEVARNLGLGQPDLELVLDSDTPLDFIIPEDEEERYFSLKNLVYMMVVDGEIDENEYQLCVSFAKRIGLGQEAVEKIIAEYESLRDERATQQSEVEAFNLDVYLDVYHAFSQLKLSVEAWLDHLREMEKTGRWQNPEPVREEEEVAALRFFWLLLVRSFQLSDEAEMMIPIYLDLSRSKRNFHDLLEFMITLEQTHGAQDIGLMEMEADVLKREINDRLHQWV